MTLIIALIANSIHSDVVGSPFMWDGWIVLLWIVHLMVHKLL